MRDLTFLSGVHAPPLRITCVQIEQDNTFHEFIGHCLERWNHCWPCSKRTRKMLIFPQHSKMTFIVTEHQKSEEKALLSPVCTSSTANHKLIAIFIQWLALVWLLLFFVVAWIMLLLIIHTLHLVVWQYMVGRCIQGTKIPDFVWKCVCVCGGGGLYAGYYGTCM